MGNELDTYKRNRINELQNIFNSNLAVLRTNLTKNTNIINSSRLNVAAKRSTINNLINAYNIAVTNLQNKLNSDIKIIQSFVPPQIKINRSKKALLIGINYIDTQNELKGCINDALAIKDRITTNGFTDITLLTDKTSIKPTKSNIINAFKNLLSNSQSGDLLFVIYSGHGSYTLDRNGDEKTGYDQMIVPLDFNMIIDDELKQIIQSNLKSGVTLFAMFDSCFSGSVLDLKYQYMDSLNYDNYSENSKELETQGDVYMISGCNDKQTSADAEFNNKPNGAMTWSLLESLKQKPNCSWRDLMKSMRDLLRKNGYDQIPQFSCGRFENIDDTIFI
jgi:hypothetical protein